MQFSLMKLKKEKKKRMTCTYTNTDIKRKDRKTGLLISCWTAKEIT